MLSVLRCVKQWDSGMLLDAQDHAVLVCARSARMGMLRGQAELAHWRSAGMMLWVPFAFWHEKTPLERRVKQVKLKKPRGMDFCCELENSSPNSQVEGVKGTRLRGHGHALATSLPPSQST